MAPFCLLVSACISHKPYARLDQDPHPSYVHHMEEILADDVNSDDSATRAWANEFMQGFEPAFRAYHPDLKLIGKLKKYTDSLEVQVIGGNWCSDTRRELPRLCKVLYYAGLSTDKMGYYKVDKEKKPLNNDFAKTYTFSFIPTIVVYYKGKEMGKIVEVTRYSMEQDLLNLLAPTK